MSKDFARSFFPSLTSFVSAPARAPSVVVAAWDAAFPDDVAVLCRLPRKHPYSLQRPCLAMAAMIGAVLGLRRDAREGRTPSRDADDAAVILAASIRASLSTGLAYFGWMNVVALVHHCLLPPPSSYPQAHSVKERLDTFLWGADCIFTGLSSTNLVVVAWLLYGSRVAPRSIRMLRIAAHVALFGAVALLPIIAQSLHDGRADFWAAGRTSIELAYILPLNAAAAFLLPLLVADAFFGRGRRSSAVGARLALVGGALAIAGLPLDAPLCYLASTRMPGINTSPLLHDVHRLPTLVFVGCDLAVFGVKMWVSDMTRALTVGIKKEP